MKTFFKEIGQVLSPTLWIYLAFLNVISLVVIATHGVDAFGWEKLCQWDCGWYSSIVRTGYISSIPPEIQKPWDSNVAFFPLYPALAWVFHRVFSLEVEQALPIVSAAFAFGVLFLVSWLARGDWKRVLLLLAYPGSFYLFVSYSESLYLFFLLLGILLLRESKSHPLAVGTTLLVSGFALGATRFSGFIIPGAVFGIAIVFWVYAALARRSRPFPLHPGLFLLGAVLGTGAFFYYTHAKFGLWNLYFVTVERGWKKESDLLSMAWLFIAALPFNLMPFIRIADPMRMSRIVTADFLLIYGWVAFQELRRYFRMLRERAAEKLVFDSRAIDFALVLGGFAHLFATALGDSGEQLRWINGTRYSMPPFYLLVLLWREEWCPVWILSRPKLRKALFWGLVVFGFGLEIYYLRRFTLGEWVS